MNTNFSYIGRKSCGCLVAAIIDDPDDRQDVSRAIAKWVREGLTVERVTHDVVRAEFTRCQCEMEQPKQTSQLALFGEGDDNQRS